MWLVDMKNVAEKPFFGPVPVTWAFTVELTVSKNAENFYLI